MNFFFIAFFVLLGFIFGSFLNVVSLRFNTGKSLGGRSMCFSCSNTLRWFELIPVVSWLVQRGRCRTCSSRISRELIASEIGTGLIFGILAARGIWSEVSLFGEAYITGTFFLVAVFSVLVVILFYDLRHKIIPDSLSLTFAILAFLSMFFFDMADGVFIYSGVHTPGIFQVLAGVLVPLPFVLVWLFSKGRLIGLGDPKLMVGMGWLLGLSYGFSAVFLSFWIGSFFALVMYLIQKTALKKLFSSSKQSIMKTEIPFAPFLILGLLTVLGFGVNVLSF